MGGFAGSQKAGRIPAYGLFHIGIEWEGQEETWLEGWHASVTIDNLFDKNYCDYATYGTSFYPGAGRSLVFRLGYDF